jgi:hypothetical protein
MIPSNLHHLTNVLREPSCGTSSWDAQTSLHAAVDAARRSGDGRLAAILRRAQAATRPSKAAGGPAASLSWDAAAWRHAERRVCRLLRRAGHEVWPWEVRP